MKFDTHAWKERARQDFERAWHDGPSVLSPPRENEKYPRLRYHRAQEHPIFSLVNRLRETYLSLGFDEICNPLMVEEQDVYRQFGPEAMAVLDRVFYLGGLPRPNVGISQVQLQQIGEILGSPVSAEGEQKLRETLHAYKKATIDGDDLVHEIASVLSADDAAVVRLLDAVFPEFRELSPESSRTTLRSHMTSGWFPTLRSLWERTLHPIRLFSVDRCFRREQQEGPTRLMTYHSASCVVADEAVTNEEGKAVSEALLSAFGFTDFRFQPDEKRSKYYMPGTQTEVYARHPFHNWVEVATFGIYSPSALSEYDIGVPVMNLGLGVERLAMIVHGAEDVRVLSYPQFYPRPLSDREIVASVQVKEEPATVDGRRLAGAIEETARLHASDPGPCSFLAWEGELSGTRIRVFVEEKETNTKLCGPACFNEIYAYHGSILGVPDTDKWAEVRKDGISTGITYVRAVSLHAAARIEALAGCRRGESVQVKMARTAPDINIAIAEHALRFITSEKKKIDVRGPVFLTVRSETE
ncbi:MAG: O-phosphoserine--tRNA ligase [Methanomicrobiales archaeon]|nr:O-phosphoserine--tRNA ligase [Methanomicrobiales archaeon]